MALAEFIPGSRLPAHEGVKTPHFLSREHRHSPEKEPKPLILVASESQRRIDFIQDVFDLAEPPQFIKPSSVEDNTQGCGIPIVMKKNDDAIKQLPLGIFNTNHRRARTILIASDVRPHIFGVENGVCITKAKSKPKNIEPARQDIFADMIRASQKADINPYYYLDVATEVVTLRGDGAIINRLPMAHTTFIELDPEKTAYIANNQQGFSQYCQELQSTIDSPYHLPNGDPKIINIAGLLDFITALRLGLVTKIGQTSASTGSKEEQIDYVVSRDNPGFAAAAQGVAHDAYISYIPAALKSLVPDIGQKTANYLPIKQLTSYGLRQIG
jgi:hypothetical protein